MITEQQLIYALAIEHCFGVDNGEFGVLWFDTNPLPFARDIIAAAVAEGCKPVYQVASAYGDPWRAAMKTTPEMRAELKAVAEHWLPDCEPGTDMSLL